MRIESRISNRLEVNDIYEGKLELQRAQTFIDEDGIKQKILAMTPKEARGYGAKHGAHSQR